MKQFESQEGTLVFVGAFLGLIATSPWLVAADGWAQHWNIYINASLTMGGLVLWAVVYVACRDMASREAPS